MSRKVGISRIVLFLMLFACGHKDPMFVQLDPSTTGVAFSNSLSVGDSLSVLDFEYMYNGGGVGIADFNNDGLQDIYFSGNMVTSRLYVNRGNMQFEDVTEKAGVKTNTWANGVSIVDINLDGFQDIYVSVGGTRHTPETERRNLLFINNGNATFIESAEKYNLADTGFGIQSTFFDYDLDGDLDMYLLQNAFVSYSRNQSKPKLVKGEAASTDKLFRNNGDNTFTDVSKDAGITIEGFGLGVVVSDINDDGWPDVYVSNDFITNDLLWINNKDGTFTNRVHQYLKHQTYNGMGVDVQDYNNDARVDIVVLDMLPEDNKRWKLTPRGNTYDEFHNALKLGYEPQYVRNTLQLNNGNGSFSEIGQLAGIEATEWSWAALFADYDNDGLKDLFITNGYRKDITNLDFIVYGDKEQSMGLPSIDPKERQRLLNELPGIKIHNYAYRNRGDLTFDEVTEPWGLSMPSYSNGAAYGDLDNDGDLDLVVNNIDEPAFILRNMLRDDERKTNSGSNYLRISAKGPTNNPDGVGLRVIAYCGDTVQSQYLTPVRGYLSSVEPFVHFGMNAIRVVDSVKAIWPDGKVQLMKSVSTNQLLVLSYNEARGEEAITKPVDEPLFEEVAADLGIAFQHRENPFVDFKVQPILPHMHSRNGPGIGVADVNGDRLDDLYIGGAAGQSGALFIQTSEGFKASTLTTDSASEDLGILFVDVDNDDDVDLYISAGGSEHGKEHEAYQDELYLNDGQGNFTPASQMLPRMPNSTSCVVAADYDKDNDLDLFVGGRVTPGAYPMPSPSFLLRNDLVDGKPTFVIANESVGLPGELGMICAALWSDYDNDGWIDLIVAGEFTAIRFFHNEEGKLVEETKPSGLSNSAGWWNSLAAADFDSDGDVDYVAGNLGLNSHFHTSADEPLCIYASDYNKDGRIDPVMSYYIQGEKYIGHSRDQLIDQINSMRNRFRTYSSYADATFEQSFLPAEIQNAYVVCAQRFESSYIENLGNGKFAFRPLPLKAQISPMYGITTGDFNDDGNIDILAIGNSYSTEIISGWDDASTGWLLLGDGKGGFTDIDVTKSGFMADQDGKALATLSLGDQRKLLVASNNSGNVEAFAAKRNTPIYSAKNDDLFALTKYADGRVRRQEFYFGSSYLSTESRTLEIDQSAVSVVVVNSKGEAREVLNKL